MFGKTKRKSSNVRVMQIFHELKAQFPTIPDHIINSCIASYLTGNNSSSGSLHDFLVTTAAAAANQPNQMGRPSIQLETPPVAAPPETTQQQVAASTFAMKEGDSDDRPPSSSDAVVPKRPNTLNIKPDKFGRIRLSEKCRDVHKLLNSPLLAEKPPRSPLSSKRINNTRDSPTSKVAPPNKKETASTPTQTTDTLVLSPSVNLSLNVNCQMGLVQSPPSKPKSTTRVELTPAQPWLLPFSDPSTSPRSFTSVNLTLRPPTSTPQDPIDITSQNSSLTYSTSSFDRHKGLQSRLQITVGPGNAGSVQSVRTRPRSCHLMGDSPATASVPVARSSSLTNLATTVSLESPAVIRQQAKIDRMKIELQTENTRLVIIRGEVEDLEKRQQSSERKAVAELEHQLKLEIKHLTVQCDQLNSLLNKGASFPDEFYNNIYTGPRGPLLNPARPPEPRRAPRGRLLYQIPEIEGPKWNCSLCTFSNHPDLDKCEQCDMPRVVHGRTNSSLTIDAIKSIPNPVMPLPYDMFKKSASALKRSFQQEPRLGNGPSELGSRPLLPLSGDYNSRARQAQSIVKPTV